VEDLSGTSTGARMQRYLAEALPLGKSAVAAAMGAADLDPGDVGLFVVCSCTGYGTPGLDILLARDLGMATSTQRVFVGHMGCYAALPGLGVAADFARARGRPAVLLCLELTSLHAQPLGAGTGGDEAGQIVAHALFSDAAAAVAVLPGAGPGYRVLDVAAVTDVATADHMTWEVTDLGFRMGLSRRVPEVLRGQVAGLVDDLLGRYGLGRDEVAGWAVHPGGPKVLDVVEQRLELPGAALAPSREVLAWHGNCSSATVLMILDALAVPRDGYAVLLAFGPGLTLYAVLLRRD